jgi:hypothetical protein
MTASPVDTNGDGAADSRDVATVEVFLRKNETRNMIGGRP